MLQVPEAAGDPQLDLHGLSSAPAQNLFQRKPARPELSNRSKAVFIELDNAKCMLLACTRRYQALPHVDLHGLSTATGQLALVDVLRRCFKFFCTSQSAELGDLKARMKP